MRLGSDIRIEAAEAWLKLSDTLLRQQTTSVSPIWNEAQASVVFGRCRPVALAKQTRKQAQAHQA